MVEQSHKGHEFQVLSWNCEASNWSHGLLDLVLEERKPVVLDLFSSWSVAGVRLCHLQDKLVLDVQIFLKWALVAKFALDTELSKELGLLHAGFDPVGHLVKD